MSSTARLPQTPVGEMSPPELADELQWWAEHTDVSTGYGRGLERLLAAASDMLRLGVPCPLCDAETVCRASQGERKWLHCFTCKADFAPEQATFQAGFERGLAEGTPDV